MYVGSGLGVLNRCWMGELVVLCVGLGVLNRYWMARALWQKRPIFLRSLLIVAIGRWIRGLVCWIRCVELVLDGYD